MKRKIAILMTMILLVTTIFTSTVLADTDDTQPCTEVLFEDNFDSYTQETGAKRRNAMLAAGWNTGSAYDDDLSYITGTTFTVPSSRTAASSLEVDRKAGSDKWQNYTVEATLTFSDDVLTGTIYAGLLGRYNKDADEKALAGYDLRIYETAEGEQGIEIYCRRTGEYVKNLIVDSTETKLFERGIPVNLKFTLNGATLKAYVNNELKFKGFDENVQVGWPGIRTSQGSYVDGATNCGVDVIFDDFKVTTTDILFYDDFSSYTDEEDLSKMAKNGWDMDDAEINFTSHIDTFNQNYSTDRTTYVSTSGANGAYGWNDYVVEADVCIGAGEIGTSTYDEETGTTTYSKGGIYAGIAGRATERVQSGYELTIYINMSAKGVVTEGVRLYRRNSTKLGVTASSGDDVKTVAMDIEQGKTYELALEFKGNQIYGYVDGERVISYTADTTQNYYSHGFAKIWTSYSGTTNANSIVDNFLVYKQDLTQEKMYENFDSYSSSTTQMKTTEKGMANWNSTILTNASARFCDGSAYTVSSTIAPRVVTANAWSGKHFVQTEVKLAGDKPTADVYAAIAGNITEASYDKSGYEFAIYQTTENDYGARLYRRQNTDASVNNANLDSGTLSELTSGTITTLTKDVSHILKMEFDGFGGIKCYLDGILLITATDSSYLSGYAGIRTAGQGQGITISYDNFAVYDYSYVSEVIGDVDESGLVATTDFTLLQDILLEKEDEQTSADVNKDAACNIVDLIRLDKLITSF